MDNSRKKAVRKVIGWAGYTILVTLYVACTAALGYFLLKIVEPLFGPVGQWWHVVFGGSAVIILAVFAIRAVYLWAWNKREGK